ncbi:MAG: 16S rRNA (guanine(966)-N(2))-methyltransferase RsmD [Candidatus Omnitrophica bacterium]|nr:16S rRNA (guanine(966)-N(2))-methyltransferase RsmD [Candidatus Omnitrophota bacterium]
MKILSGRLKGRNFYMPFGIRPTSDIIRKSLFDFLGDAIDGADFLDLFAGSGAVGLEAISRGAKNITFIEKDPKCVSVIEENLMLLELPARERTDRYFDVKQVDSFAVIKAFSAEKKQFDIIFVDPPYDRELAKKALKTLCGYDIVKPNSLIIFQHEKNEALPKMQGCFSVIRERKFGSSLLTVYGSN